MFTRILRLLMVLVFCLGCLPAAATTLRVAVVREQQTLALQADSPFLVTDQISGTAKELPKGKYFLRSLDGKIYLDDINYFNNQLRIDGVKGKELPYINGRRYPGSFSIRSEAGLLTLVNQVELEGFLCQVLPAKTMVVWPDEVIKAQAVAARSYALHQMYVHAADFYDMIANDEELPYIGVTKYSEKKDVSKLILATKGQYMEDEQGVPILGITTSSTGGKTDSAQMVLGKAYPYLVSVEDYDQDSPEYRWQKRVVPAMMQQLLEQKGFKVGKLNSVRLSTEGDSGLDRNADGRVRYIVFAGDAGSARIAGQELVELLELNSNLFNVETGTPIPESLKVPITNSFGMEIGSKEIPIKVKESDKPVWSNLNHSIHMLNGGQDERIIFKGKGKGSGLGLSAWGARGMVNAAGKTTYVDILEHYYPGTHLVK